MKRIIDDRLPPHSTELEAGVLGAILWSPDKVAGDIERLGLNANSFYELRHRVIYEAIAATMREGKLPDNITVVHKLIAEGKLENAGGLGYIASLPDVSWYVFEQHAKDLADLRLRREVIKQATAVEDRAHDLHQSVESIRTDMEFLVTACGPDPGKLSEICDSFAIAQKEVVRPPELVYGLLYGGSKLVLGGGSKTFKTWTLMDLALSVAYGEPWLSFKTNQGKVLYLNFELADFVFRDRLLAIAKSKNMTLAPDKLDIWNLRGQAASYEVLFPKILDRIKTARYSLIILDPIYKCYGGTDENSAGQVAQLLNAIEHLAVQTGAAVAFGAHFAKGNAAGKESIDRISGSGVFARDPDALLTFTKHEAEDAFTVEATLRNFKPITPFVARFIYPLMRRDESLDPKRLRGSHFGRRKQNDALGLLTVIENTSPTSPVSIAKWSLMAKVDRSTLYEYLPEMLVNGWVGVVGEGKSARRYITPAGLSALNTGNDGNSLNQHAEN